MAPVKIALLHALYRNVDKELDRIAKEIDPDCYAVIHLNEDIPVISLFKMASSEEGVRLERNGWILSASDDIACADAYKAAAKIEDLLDV